MKNFRGPALAFGVSLVVSATFGVAMFMIEGALSRQEETLVLLGTCALLVWGLCVYAASRARVLSVITAGCGLMWGYWGAIVVAVQIDGHDVNTEWGRVVLILLLYALGACLLALPVGGVSRLYRTYER